jgi:4-hydroxy-3-polyprenylbenzoate decarboxylase
MGNENRPRIIVGITGATGTMYGVRALQILRQMNVETHLVISRADVVHPIGDVGATIASGSFRTLGMIVAPCSVKTLAEVATGVASTLLTRAADVVLKERRRLVLLVRETPLHAGHLKNMLSVTEMGGIIFPPVPAFYTKPVTIEEMVDQTVTRALDYFGLEVPGVARWGETEVVRGEE